MINKKDFKLSKNGPGMLKKYRVHCDICGKDRGYKRERDAYRPCRYCSKRICTPINVDIKDSIPSPSSQSGKRLYRTLCIACNSDKGYRPITSASQKCHSCCMLERWKNGTMNNMKSAKRKFQYIKLGITIYFKSSYELAYAKYLDSNNIGWSYEPVYILSDGTNILPDFLLDNGTVVEIKGYFRPDAKIKWNRFCNEYPDLNKLLLMKADLQNLYII